MPESRSSMPVSPEPLPGARHSRPVAVVTVLDQVLGLFGIVPDIDLDIMQPGQTLTGLTGRLLIALERVLSAERPDAVLVQGDTTTVLATALAAQNPMIHRAIRAPPPGRPIWPRTAARAIIAQ